VPPLALTSGHALAVGRQLSDLNTLDAGQIDSVLSGIRSSLLAEEPEVPLSEYVPKAMAMLNAKKAAQADVTAKEGVAALAAAANEPDAVKTASGLVVRELVAGKGEPNQAPCVSLAPTPGCYCLV